MDRADLMPGRVEVDDERLELAFRRVADSVGRGDLPAAALALGLGDRVLGVRTVTAPGEPDADDRSLFAVASISKPIVAAAVLQLVEDGLLSLSDPLVRHLPELAPDRTEITAWHVLTHTSGLPEVDWPTALAARDDAPLGFEEACRRPLLSAPGRAYRYSTLSFYLLGELIARLGGPSFTAYLERRILEPLGLTAMTLDPRARPDGPRTVPIEGVTAGLDVTSAEATDAFIALATPGGGLWAPASEVLTFGQELLRIARTGRRGILSAATVELMTRDHTGGLPHLLDEDGLPVHRALGWGTGPRVAASGLPGSGRVFEHNGATGGTLWVDPDWDLVFVFLGNSFTAGSSARRAALQVVYSALRRA